MTDKKNGNAFTNNPLVRAIGVQKIVVVIVLIALIAFFSAVSPSFRQYSTLLSIMDYTYYLAFLGIGVTFCLITGGVDLSIGTGMFCYALIGGYLITRQGMPVIVGILATLICGLVMGIINGLIVSKGGHAPFLATLCTMMIARGLGAIATGGAQCNLAGRYRTQRLDQKPVQADSRRDQASSGLPVGHDSGSGYEHRAQ